jgi:hypothetical protein
VNAALAATGWRQRSLYLFIAVSAGFVAIRLLSTLAFLLFGPGLGVEAKYATAQTFFLLSKAFLGGLFWPISLAIEGWRDPLGWLLYPW